MKIMLILFLVLFSNIGHVAESTQSDKIKAGVKVYGTDRWASASKSSDGHLRITFEFLMDNVDKIIVQDLNYESKGCTQQKGYSRFNAEFNPENNIHWISTLFNNLCFSEKNNTHLNFLVRVRTKEGRYFHNNSTLIVYTPMNRNILFEK